MASKLVECLNCGAVRHISQLHECARCGYVGWAEAESLTEALRRALRERSVEQRRHIAAW